MSVAFQGPRSTDPSRVTFSVAGPAHGRTDRAGAAFHPAKFNRLTHNVRGPRSWFDQARQKLKKV